MLIALINILRSSSSSVKTKTKNKNKNAKQTKQNSLGRYLRNMEGPVWSWLKGNYRVIDRSIDQTGKLLYLLTSIVQSANNNHENRLYQRR